VVAACAGADSGPTSPVSSKATVAFPVVVFYDENGNGVLDPAESVRLQNVTVSATGGVTARTGQGGVATLQVQTGEQRLSVVPESLPSYYQPGSPVTVNVPGAAQAVLAVTLPIGSNRPNTYMGFGDSITVGEGSSDLNGYRVKLQQKLQAYFGLAEVDNEGVSATRTPAGADRIGASLLRTRPAYTLIHYGTNDYNQQECRSNFPCFTIDNLRSMVRQAKAAGSLPILATIIPTNTNYNPFVPPERNDWLRLMNQLIREMASQEGAVVADQWQAFFNQIEIGPLFDDHIHPNDAGYTIMANTWFEAITRARLTAASAGFDPRVLEPGVGFVRPEEAAKHHAWPLVVPKDRWDKGPW
jgi:lysophospholipase L1-like esterase